MVMPVCDPSRLFAIYVKKKHELKDSDSESENVAYTYIYTLKIAVSGVIAEI
jgi:hypothetical protein